MNPVKYRSILLSNYPITLPKVTGSTIRNTSQKARQSVGKDGLNLSYLSLLDYRNPVKYRSILLRNCPVALSRVIKVATGITS